MITPRIKCAACLDRTACAHSGARWLCRRCWTALIDAPWPVKEAAGRKLR